MEGSFPQRISRSNCILQQGKLDATAKVAGGEEAPNAVADLVDDVGKTNAETLPFQINGERRHVSVVFHVVTELYTIIYTVFVIICIELRLGSFECDKINTKFPLTFNLPAFEADESEARKPAVNI